MVHQYKLNGYNIVLDVFSGSVHVVDEVAYDIIEMYENSSKDDIIKTISERYPDVTVQDIEDCISDVEELKAAGKLFTEDKYADLAFDFKKKNTVIKALCLHIAHTCNLNCEYCFASQGKYHGERALMSLEVGKRAIDFLIENSGKRVNLEVDFFGGEPLMNFDVVKGIVEYARSIEKQHNKKGSYDIIVPKFQHFVERRGNKGYYVRGTFTHNNVDFTEDIFHMADLGFTELSMEPVVCSPDDPYALTEEDLPKLYEQYEILAKYMINREKDGKPITFYHYMIDLTGGPCIYKRISGCGSGTEYLAVTPWGDLYPCHQFVGDEKYLMGDIWKGVTNKEMQDEFKLCNVYARQDCKNCWAKLYCSGGCAANAYHATGSITGIYEYGCKLFRKRMECAIMLQIAKSLEK